MKINLIRKMSLRWFCMRTKRLLSKCRGIFVSAGIFFAAVIAVCPISCRSSVEGLEFLSGDFSVPKVTNFCTVSSGSAKMDFSREVEIRTAELFSSDNESLGEVECGYSEDSVLFTFGSETATGLDYKMEGVAVDSSGNSLTFSVGFKGFNENPARAVITEVRNDYGQKTSNKVKVHRSEFVELYILKGGNLSGFEIIGAANSEKTKFVLPAVEVRTGDYVTLHLRTIEAEGLDGEGMVSELGENLALSTHEDSCDEARDLWNAENSKKPFADNDVVLFRDSNSGKIYDAVVFATSECTAWRKNSQDFSSELAESGVWPGGTSISGAVCCDNLSPTKSLSRQNLEAVIKAFEAGEPLPNGKDCWILAKSATPGYKNSSVAYVK
ncbi:hypothetical protein [Treponema sp.]|uniref:hypothetical protein n=1 Tax=Treponema sp. TaxID=166 RepID=UPI003F06FDE9